MKKIVKMTLFKKIFCIMFCSFVLIEVIHVYFDLQTNIRLEVDRLMNNDVYEELFAFAEEYNEKKTDEQLTDMVNRYFLASDGYYAITKENSKDILMEKWCNNYKTSLSINMENGEYLDVDLNNVDINVIEHFIEQTYNHNNDHEFKLSIKGEKIIDEESESIKIIPQYLSIDDLVLVGDDNSDAEVTTDINYLSNTMYYIKNNPKKYQFLKFADVYDISRAIVKKEIERIDDKSYIRHGDDLYTLESIVDNGIEISYVRYDRGGYSDTLDKTIKDKYSVYLIDFVLAILVSLIISYMITRRIKKIESVTEKIANNHFDEKLETKSKDELGSLSKHINVMSSQLKQKIQQLNNEIEQVKKLEVVRQEFIANFTHEIKTPLGIIDGYIELIHDTDDQKKKEQYLVAIEQEIERIDKLVKAMLDLSKLEAGKVELKIEDVNLDDLITVVIDSMISLIQKKHLKINIKGNNTIIQADPFEFEIVIKNILNNAIKFTPEYGHINICYDKNMISIENEGLHLSDEQIESIWNTYVSGDRQGTGLGLAICKSILNLHGFSCKVYNTQKGVCFLIKIKE